MHLRYAFARINVMIAKYKHWMVQLIRLRPGFRSIQCTRKRTGANMVDGAQHTRTLLYALRFEFDSRNIIRMNVVRTQFYTLNNVDNFALLFVSFISPCFPFSRFLCIKSGYMWKWFDFCRCHLQFDNTKVTLQFESEKWANRRIKRGRGMNKTKKRPTTCTALK